MPATRGAAARSEVAEGGCERRSCRVVYVRTAWRKRKGKSVKPTVTTVTVTADKPKGALVGMIARTEAVDKIEEAFGVEARVTGAKCPGDCVCNYDEPSDDDFVYTGWMITVKFHIGGRDTNDQSDRIDYTATFEALRAEVVVWGDCVSGYA